jgi:hypothetical protein
MSKLSFALVILVLHFTFHSIQAQPGETKARTATVSGRVTLKGEPARGVEVIMVTNIIWSANSPRARTDENGRFSLTSVAAGSYMIYAVAPGYVSPNESSISTPGRSLSVADGEKVENVDLEIKRGGVIAGRIKDSQGRPVIEETITLSKLDGNNKSPYYRPFSSNHNIFQTDDRGVYRIYGLPEGRYRVSIGYSPDEQSIAQSRAFYPRVFYPNATSKSEAKVIEVSEGSEATDVDITVSDPKEARDVSGRVVDAGTGEPVERVGIEVFRVSSDSSHRDGVGESESGPNGAFHVYGLLPGKYALLTQSRWSNGFVSDPVIFDVSEGDASGIELKVRRYDASISGVVVIEGTNDPKVLAKLSQSFVNASIDPADPKLQSPVEMLPIRVNADGSFRISGLPAGKARIDCCGQNDLSVARIERNGAPVGEEIEIDSGEQVTGVRVVSLYGALTLRGELKIVGGTLPADCTVGAAALRTDQNAMHGQSVAIDARGQFVIENLAPGEYEIRVYPHCLVPEEIMQRFSSVRKRVFVGSDNQQSITVEVDLSRKEEDK